MGVFSLLHGSQLRCRHDAERELLEQSCAAFNENSVGDAELLGFYPQERPEVLSGSSKPSADPDRMFESLLHLRAGVTALRRRLPDAAWEVALDDVAVEWSEERGYELPGLENLV